MIKHREIIEKLTLEQKTALLASLKALANPEYAEAGIPCVRYSGSGRMNARCGNPLPSFAAMANSWDTALIADAASLLAAQAHADGVNFMFTPVLRLKSDPYQRGLSEDPLLADHYARAIVSAFRNGGVMPCLSGFSLNERDVAQLDATPDARVMHEYFFRPFAAYAEGENAVSLSYTPLSGAYAEMNTKIIGDYLKKQSKSGYAVCTQTDKSAWTQAVRAGDLLWSGDLGAVRAAVQRYTELVNAVNKGELAAEELEDACARGEALDERSLDEAVDRAIGFAFACERAAQASKTEEQQDLAFRVAAESIVLLKNENMLPLRKGCSVAVIGRIPTAFSASETAFAEALRRDGKFTLAGTAAGYDVSGERSDDMAEEACRIADPADVVVLFLGSDVRREEELLAGRKVRLPANQLALVSALAERGKKVVAVLAGNVYTDMSFDGAVSALLVAPVDGTGCADALLAVLSGAISPSGKLAVTCFDDADSAFAAARADKEAGKNKVGMFIGYRHYDTAGIKVRYPFGYGLSYTTFDYSSLEVSSEKVSFTVKNTGSCEGAEIAQVYLGKVGSAAIRPKKELAAFARVTLKAGESKRVTLAIDAKDMALFTNEGKIVEQGEYEVSVGGCVDRIRLRGTVTFKGKRIRQTGEKLSDYLQTYSNVLTGGYTFGNIRTMPRKGRRLTATGAVFTGLFALAAILLLIFNATEMIPYELSEAMLGVFIISACLTVLGIILIVVGCLVRRRAVRNAEIISRENTSMQDEPVQPEKPYESLFDDVFKDADEESDDAGSQTQPQRRGNEFFRHYDASVTFPAACGKLVKFAADRGLVLDRKAAAKIFSSMCASRLILLSSKTLSFIPKLLEVLGEFFGSGCYMDRYTSFRSAEDMLLRSSESGYRAKSQIARAIAGAETKRNTVHMAVLDAVSPEDIVRFFMPFARYVNYPDGGSVVTLRESDHSENAYTVSPNVWFVFVLKEGADLSAVDAYIANMAAYLDLDVSVTEEAAEKTEEDAFGYYQLMGLGRAARDAFSLEEEKCWKKVDKFREYVSRSASFNIDNREWTRMEKYASAYLACGGEQTETLDCMVAAKLLLPAMAALAGKRTDGEYNLLGTLDTVFGEENIPECKRIASAFGIAAAD